MTARESVRSRVLLRDRVLERYVRFIQPAESGLPNWRILFWFPVLASILVAVLILLQWSGSSSGVHWATLGSGDDPRLIFGEPRPIRSDEWLVQQSWVVSQSNWDYAGRNETFPGGADATVLSELPTWDWSSLFRPHLWGYLFFGLDTGVAWHWWVPGLALVVGCYLFVVSMLPRRPLVAAFLAIATYFTPLLQWFYTPSSVWPVAWTFLALAATVWIYRDPRGWVRIAWSALVGYLAITMAMGLYIPFILPGVYAFVAFAIGYALRIRPWRGVARRATVVRVLPFVVAGVGALAVTGIYALTRLSTFDAIQSTVYPGQRSLPTGDVMRNDPFLAGFAGAPWEKALHTQGASILGGNASEGSSVILLALFLLPGVLWYIAASITARKIDWLMVACVAYLVLILAYLFLPGWDAVAHILQFDRIAPERFRIVFVVLLPLFAVLIIEKADGPGSWRKLVPALLSSGATLVVLLILWRVIRVNDPAVLVMASHWKITVALILGATFLLFFRRFAVIGAGMVMIAALTLSWGVNPVYKGIFDLSETTIGNEVQSIDSEDPGSWVGIGSYEAMAILMQSGVESFSGVQNYPSDEMWSEIDPDSRYEGKWNRLAHVQWTMGVGEPVVTSPWGDVVSVTLDACSDFAQSHVDYVLTDQGPLASTCLTEIEATTQGTSDMRVYEVTPAV